jgi:hypothetical protein
MRFKIQDFGIASGLAASALLVSSQNQTEITELEKVVGSDSIQAFDQLLMVSDQEAEVEDENPPTVVINIPAEPEWDEVSMSRFSELAGKFAIQGHLNEAENDEYANLKTLRRRTHLSRSYDEIVADQELHKRVSDAIKSLKTLVEYATATYPSETQENRS